MTPDSLPIVGPLEDLSPHPPSACHADAAFLGRASDGHLLQMHLECIRWRIAMTGFQSSLQTSTARLMWKIWCAQQVVAVDVAERKLLSVIQRRQEVVADDL